MNPTPFKVMPPWMVLGFFWIGLIGASSVRLLAFVTRYDAHAALWLWRFAMACYVLFFGYRVWIGYRRRHLIRSQNLVEHVSAARFADPQAQEATLYILHSILRSKELFNYTFIWLLSVGALLIDLFLPN